jgi:hypothetical protein
MHHLLPPRARGLRRAPLLLSRRTNDRLPSQEVVDLVQFWASVAAILALPIGIGAVFYAGLQLSLARKAGSGTSLIALSEAFRQCWQAFLTAQDEKRRQVAFGDLINALEVACAIFRDKVFFGHAEDVLEHYLLSTFRLIESNDDARARMLGLLQTPRTFQNIVEFLAKHRGQGLTESLAARA